MFNSSDSDSTDQPKQQALHIRDTPNKKKYYEASELNAMRESPINSDSFGNNFFHYKIL